MMLALVMTLAFMCMALGFGLDQSQPSDFNDRIPILLARVSTSKQREGLPVQEQFLRDTAKRMGFNKKPVEITVQQSGKAADLRTLKALRKVITENPRKKYVVIVRDVPRFARNINQAIAALEFLTGNDIPLIPLDMNVPVFNEGALQRKMTFSILSAVAEGGKEPENVARKIGEVMAKRKGLVSGVPQDSYEEKTKGKPQMRRLVNALRPALTAGSISQTKAAKSVGLLRQKFMQIVKELDEREAAGKLDEWLEVWDAIVAAERTPRVGSRKKFNKSRSRVKAIHRVSVGYLQFPDEFNRPDTVGNPEVATFPPKRGEALGTLADALQNPDYYQPTR
jgi:DNA invertase Pin-like site-specific DNA recombinase